MSTNQPLSNLSALPVLEAVLGAPPSIVGARQDQSTDEHAEAWKVLEARIAGWAPPSGDQDIRSDEDGYLLPSERAVAVALQIAARLRESGVRGPDWLVQDGDGGIDFEWKNDNRAETLRIDSRGDTELIQFDHSKLLSRRPTSFATIRKE